MGWHSQELVSDFKLCCREQVSVDPFLLCAFEPPTQVRNAARAWAREQCTAHWSNELRLQVFGPIPLPTNMPEEALSVAYMNGAILLSQGSERRYRRSRQQQASGLEERLDSFIRRGGLGPMVRLFVALRIYEHARAIAHFDPIEEATFISGSEHLPAFPEWCGPDALYGLAQSWWVAEELGGNAVLKCGALGRGFVDGLRELLDSTGAFRWREHLLERLNKVYGRELGEIQLEACVSNHEAQQDEFAMFAEIRRGARILRIGTDKMTNVVSRRTVDIAGRRGDVPSQIIDDAELTIPFAVTERSGGVVLNAGTAAYARMEIPSDSLDAVIWCLTGAVPDLHRFLRETRRVLRAGGAVVIVCRSQPLDSAFFRELLGAAESVGPTAARPAFIDVDELIRGLAEEGFVDIRQRAGKLTVSFVDERDASAWLLSSGPQGRLHLIDLPYGERMRRRREIESAVAGVVRRYGPGNRLFAIPYVMVRGRKSESRSIRGIRPGLGVEVATLTVFRDGQELPLPPASANILLYLATHGPSRPRSIARELGLSEHTVYNNVRTMRCRGVHILTREARYAL